MTEEEKEVYNNIIQIFYKGEFETFNNLPLEMRKIGKKTAMGRLLIDYSTNYKVEDCPRIITMETKHCDIVFASNTTQELMTSFVMMVKDMKDTYQYEIDDDIRIRKSFNNAKFDLKEFQKFEQLVTTLVDGFEDLKKSIILTDAEEYSREKISKIYQMEKTILEKIKVLSKIFDGRYLKDEFLLQVAIDPDFRKSHDNGLSENYLALQWVALTLLNDKIGYVYADIDWDKIGLQQNTFKARAKSTHEKSLAYTLNKIDQLIEENEPYRAGMTAYNLLISRSKNQYEKFELEDLQKIDTSILFKQANTETKGITL